MILMPESEKERTRQSWLETIGDVVEGLFEFGLEVIWKLLEAVISGIFSGW